MIKINEIFRSIQGESTRVGLPTVFVRTTGCPLRCSYCDTKYSYYEGEFQTIPNLIERITAYKTKAVCITGGEPLLQKEVLKLMTQLCDLGHDLSLETSGARSCREVDPRVRLILDVKTPDSGAADSFLLENLEVPATSEFKFVISSEKDFNWAESFCRQYDLFNRYTVLYSPVHGSSDPRWLAESILKNFSSARLQLQLHKYIWSSDQRGV